MTPQQSTDPYTQAHSPDLANIPHSGWPAQDHDLDEAQHPEYLDAVREFAKRCGECGQTLPGVTG